MKEETKAAFKAAMAHHEARKAEAERKKADELARQRALMNEARRVKDDVILPALKEIASEVLEPNGWQCSVRSGQSGISAILETFKDEMRAVNGGRPAITFTIDAQASRITVSEATRAQDAVGDAYVLSSVTPDFVQEQALQFFQHLTGEQRG